MQRSAADSGKPHVIVRDAPVAVRSSNVLQLFTGPEGAASATSAASAAAESLPPSAGTLPASSVVPDFDEEHAVATATTRTAIARPMGSSVAKHGGLG
jgi:hypothetical protein